MDQDVRNLFHVTDQILDSGFCSQDAAAIAASNLILVDQLKRFEQSLDETADNICAAILKAANMD